VGRRLDCGLERLESGRLQADDPGVASLFKTNGVEWVKGAGVQGREHADVEAGGRSFKSAIVATGSYRCPPIEGSTRPLRRLDRLLAQEQVPRRLIVLGGGIGCGSPRSSTASAPG
jgi:pyruvate/2-oxoglutarate dehydrogenase complex dihydrolipoamide dehydrogenase (E3) component